VSIPDDEQQFERYLRQFRPVALEPLMAKKQTRSLRRSLVLTAWAATAAAILLAAMLSVVLHKPTPPAQDVSKRRPGMEEFSNPQPLTIASANALLADAPSFKAAVDNMAFQQKSKPISNGRYSLLALLSKEEVKQ
jgi:hypothetical protein